MTVEIARAGLGLGDIANSTEPEVRKLADELEAIVADNDAEPAAVP